MKLLFVAWQSSITASFFSFSASAVSLFRLVLSCQSGALNWEDPYYICNRAGSSLLFRLLPILRHYSTLLLLVCLFTTLETIFV